MFNTVLIVPTGIGCEIGGHAGDAQPVSRLIGQCCDNVILHPNVVNASDLNEMPPNSWYVEGSILDRFLQGDIVLEKPLINKILVAVNKADWQSINAVSAARASLGVDAEIVELNTPLELIARMEGGLATGDVNGWKELCEQIKDMKFDALGIATPITISNEDLMKYFNEGGVNPVGGVEAVASKLIADVLNKPVAHGPVDYAIPGFEEVVDPRKAVEVVTMNFIHCILKGLHQAPRVAPRIVERQRGMSVEDVNILISPLGCWGKPHKYCHESGIPIMVVKENTSVLDCDYPPNVIFAETYLDAAGLLMAMQAGVNPNSVRRPLRPTRVV